MAGSSSSGQHGRASSLDFLDSPPVRSHSELWSGDSASRSCKNGPKAAGMCLTAYRVTMYRVPFAFLLPTIYCWPGSQLLLSSACSRPKKREKSLPYPGHVMPIASASFLRGGATDQVGASQRLLPIFIQYTLSNTGGFKGPRDERASSIQSPPRDLCNLWPS